jgi:hypothetical protein
LVFVSDAGRQSVQVFGESGNWVFEIAAKGPNWKGFTLPMGLVAVDAAVFSEAAEFGAQAAAGAQDYVIVSDSLGGISLTLLGVMTSANDAAAGKK